MNATTDDVMGFPAAPAKPESNKPWWKRTKERLVRVCKPSTLKDGQKVRFTDGTIYQKQPSGALVRLHPLKPYGNRAEQRQYLKRRRAEREAAAAAEPVYGSYAEAAA